LFCDFIGWFGTVVTVLLHQQS